MLMLKMVSSNPNDSQGCGAYRTDRQDQIEKTIMASPIEQSELNRPEYALHSILSLFPGSVPVTDG